MDFLQRTVAKPIKCFGIGVHSGSKVTVRILPAAENTGIKFKRVDLQSHNMIDALYFNVSDTRLCTVIENEHGVRVSTVEHIMSALWKITNAVIEVDNEEMAIMDGSSEPFVNLIQAAGIRMQNAPGQYLKILKTIRVEEGDKFLEIQPYDGFAVDYTINFSHPAIGSQHFLYDEDMNSYNHEISRARTYGFAKEIEQLKQMGLARGGSLANAIGIDDNGVMNPEGLRYKDEFVKHKILDCIGDLRLAGYRIHGKVLAYKGGHALHNKLLHKIFGDEESYILIKQPVMALQAAIV